MESYRKSPGTVTHAASVIKHKAGMFSMKDTLLFLSKSLQNNCFIQVRQRIFQMG